MVHGWLEVKGAAVVKTSFVDVGFLKMVFFGYFSVSHHRSLLKVEGSPLAF